MPPRKGIVKSGNAGNSSKASSKPQTPAAAEEEKEKPLFPPGSKYPLSLLHERCQKNGWNKPVVDAFKSKDGWSFAVTLHKTNKKTGLQESVRMQPRPAYTSSSALEARHWGATYALHRFSNNIQLNRVLPPGPREYWIQLETERKNAPHHQVWMYEVDPFAAQATRQEAQDKKQERIEQEKTIGTDARAGSHNHSKPGDEFSQVPEVKMAGELRDLVEKAIRVAMADSQGIDDTPFALISEQDSATHIQQLQNLGFSSTQSRSVVDFFSKPSALASSLLETSTLLEACAEYLILITPECDLPQRFLPSKNSSNPFITAGHSGNVDLKTRWMYEKIQAFGWPLHCIKECTAANAKLTNNFRLLIAALNRRLIGDEWVDICEADPSSERGYDIDESESGALGASFDEDDPNLLVMPLFTAPVNLNVVLETNRRVRHDQPSLFLTSPSVPAYIRLHLLSQLLTAIKDPEAFLEPGEGFCMAAMRVLEAGWADIEDNGRPDMSTVMQNLVPISSTTLQRSQTIRSDASVPAKARRRTTAPKDNRSDQQVREDFDALCTNHKYKEMQLLREQLPAFSARDNILRQLDASRVLVVVGETGCGKTTQLPQFVLDSLIMGNKGAKASIIVTQPRRISAISVAARVSAERVDDGSVGYAIRGESKQSPRTKLIFCTTGVVLRRLGSGDNLSGVSHVIVDEVHERSVDSDFLLLELRQLLKKHKTLKVILMSATINHEIFVKYFGGCPLLTIPGRTHPVTDIYLEDILPAIDYKPVARQGRKGNKEGTQDDSFLRELQGKGYDDQLIQVLQGITSSNQLDYSLISSLINYIIEHSDQGAILVFLTGVQEIRQCMDVISQTVPASRAEILPLHANLTNDEQRRVFARTSKRKIIVSTNVAETSITIDDVLYVIDSGKVKESQHEAETGLFRLVETWTTQAAARQRQGRAGRTQPGKCYKLYTRQQEGKMGKFPIPEILRFPLEKVLLTMKVMREQEDPIDYLKQAVDPPHMTAMQAAWSVLEDLGAVDEGGRLTGLGRHISMIPVDLRLGKMLVLATIFRCLGPMLTIVACISSKPLFLNPFEKREEASRARARFSTGDSDLLTDLRAYDAFAELMNNKPRSAAKAFCEENFISSTTIREVGALRHDLISALSERGLVSTSAVPSSPSLNVNSENLNLLKSIILAGSWPNLARAHLPKSAIKFDKIQAGTVQRDNAAKEFKIYDLKEGRVFMHPSSILFDKSAWKSPFIAYIQKQQTSKVFIRGATVVPLYSLLLFGGPITVNHVMGGLRVGTRDHWIKLKAWPRIGVLVNQLRKLLDTQLEHCIEEGAGWYDHESSSDHSVLSAILALLSGDGLTGQTDFVGNIQM